MPTQSDILIGEVSDEAIKKLVAQFGGGRIYVPKQVDPNHPITQCIGTLEAQRLSKTNAGNTVFIPKKHKVTIRMRNLQILQALIRGETTDEVAKRHNMTKRNVRLIVAGLTRGKFEALQRNVRTAKIKNDQQMELEL